MFNAPIQLRTLLLDVKIYLAHISVRNFIKGFSAGVG